MDQGGQQPLSATMYARLRQKVVGGILELGDTLHIAQARVRIVAGASARQMMRT